MVVCCVPSRPMVAVMSIHHARIRTSTCVKQFLGLKVVMELFQIYPVNLGSGHKVLYDFTRLVSQLEA